jgi:hypothetical protein
MRLSMLARLAISDNRCLSLNLGLHPQQHLQLALSQTVGLKNIKYHFYGNPTDIYSKIQERTLVLIWLAVKTL